MAEGHKLQEQNTIHKAGTLAAFMDKSPHRLGVDPYERVLVLHFQYVILIGICVLVLVPSLWHKASISSAIIFSGILVFTWFLRHATRRILRNHSLPDQRDGLQ